MHTSQTPIGFWSAVSMGVGAMVGAGIFALLGEASVVAGNAVYVSFVLGGLIALLSAYSLGKLGARYPSAGGMIEYLTQAYGTGVFTGTMGVVLYLAAVVSLSLIAAAFGNYARTFLPASAPAISNRLLAIAILAVFVGINLRGAASVALIERLTVALKFAVLAGLAVGGLWFIDPERLAPSRFPPATSILFSLAVTFFAYEGFRVITNAAEDMPDPSRTLPRALITAVLLVMVLYVTVAIAVFGNLPLERIVETRDFALAEAARPVFGQTGFTLVALTALVSTASAINATLYAVTNVTYQLAKDGELPSRFGEPIAHSRQGLVISAAIAALLALGLELGEIAAIGSISVLLVHGVTHAGHLRLLAQTGASRALVGLAAVSAIGAAVTAFVYVSRDLEQAAWLLIAFLGIAAVTELLLRALAGKRIRARLSRHGKVPA